MRLKIKTTKEDYEDLENMKKSIKQLCGVGNNKTHTEEKSSQQKIKEKNLTETQKKIADVCDSLKEFLIEKNTRYGNSALEPLKIFGDFDALDLLKIRITDKLMRIKNSKIDRFNDYADLLGYLTLICVSKNWLNFNDLLD